MMKSFRHLRNTWLQLHFLLLFVVYYAGSSFFSHTHTIDGQSVTHSHPFAGSNGHHHTTAEFSIISVLSHFSAMQGADSIQLASFWLLIAAFLTPALAKPVFYYFNRTHFLRPPPRFQVNF